MSKLTIDENLKVSRHVSWDHVREMVSNSRPFYLDITGPKKEDIDNLGSIFNFHPTNLEDCTFFSESPKMEEHRSYIFTVIHSIVYNNEKNKYESFDIHLFLGENFLVSVHDIKLDVINEAVNRVKTGGERERLYCDYTYYILLDCIVDSYFPILAYWGEKVDDIEEYVFDTSTGDETISKVIGVRKGLLALKRIIMPQREIIYRISHTNIKFVNDETRIYLRDVFDHIVKSCDAVEELRDNLSNLMDAHFSKASAGLNEIMKKLTVISTIFMPLTFIVGIYGMNFKFMPELGWRYGYFFIMFIMFLAGAGLLGYFKKQKWF